MDGGLCGGSGDLIIALTKGKIARNSESPRSRGGLNSDGA